MEKIFLSVIIPAYNEAKNITGTLLDIDNYLSKQDYTYEIIVVNDGSKDNTVEVAQKVGSLVKNLRIIDNEVNHGKGWVVRQGMLKAKGEIRLFTDGDNATTIDHFKLMIPLFETGHDIVIGSREARDVPGAKQVVSQSKIKRLLGDMGNILIQIMAVKGIWDTQCGFKAFTRESAENIFGRSLINRWGFDIEALALARRLGYKIGIVPVNWKNTAYSRVGWKGYLITLRELFKLKLNLIFGKYGKK